MDLRQRIVAAVQRQDYSLRELADLFAVDLSTIVRLLQRYRDTGTVQAKAHAGGPKPTLDSQAQARLLSLVQQYPDATLAELRAHLGIACSLMTIARALKHHKISRKKKTKHASERDSPRVQKQRHDFQEKLAAVDPEHLVFIDETGANTGMSRTYGRAPESERVQAAAPGAWQNVTLTSGLRTAGVVAPMAWEGATDQMAFQTYVEQALVPELRPGDVVVWDNLAPHKNPAVIAAVEAAGARVEPLPVYSPDLTPIEEMFSKTKESLRSMAARTTVTVISAMGKALASVTQSDILGWFHDRCSYAMQV